MEELHPQDNAQHTYVLVTGANSGLGFATCCRLIDEFVTSQPPFQCLSLVLTTRDSKKSKETVRSLEKHIARQSKKLDTPLQHRVFLQPEILDLSSLRSVQKLCARLIDNLPQIDCIVCNAGIGGCIGLDWPDAIWTVATDLIHAVTWPRYRLGSIGEVTAPQSPEDTQEKGKGDEPALGQVFTSNVFGHYVLAHILVPLLSASPNSGRIVFISSVEPLASHLDIDDLQALKSEKAYESSKQLMDVLALTSTLASTQPFVQRFTSAPSPRASQTIDLLDNDPDGRSTPADSDPDTSAPAITLADNEYHPPSTPSPKIYLSHPGICATSFVPLPLILYYCMLAAMYLARWLGSPWHTCSAYKGACAPVWLALTDQEELEDMEQREGKVKWGSAVDRMGHERIMRTVVEGWGLGGRMGEEKLKGRVGTRREFEREVTKEDREGFEEVGRECWKQMEALRVMWEGRLRDVGEGN
ncbi:3-keto-steroid reductase [Lecanora helva]